MMIRRIVLEVCVASVDDAVAAVAAGADRLELNSSLELGGLTPTLGFVQEVQQAVHVPVIAMLRPRAAGFCYRAVELRVMRRDAEALLAAGVDGLAFGSLLPDGRLDLEFCHRVVHLVGDRQSVFHRAFDRVHDVRTSLRQLIDLHVTRVMSSGQQTTALEGLSRLAELVEWAGDAIEMMPACGIRADNVRQLVRATGCRQVHGSFSRPATDEGQPVCGDRYPTTDAEHVAAIRRALD